MIGAHGSAAVSAELRACGPRGDCSLSLLPARTRAARAAPVVAGHVDVHCYGAAARLELRATTRMLRAEDRLSVALLSDTLPAEWMHEAPANRALVDPTDEIPTATARLHPTRAYALRRLLGSADAPAAALAVTTVELLCGERGNGAGASSTDLVGVTPPSL